jgi:hypothetical protein
MTDTDPYAAPRPSEEHDPEHRPTVCWWVSLDSGSAARTSQTMTSIDAAIRWADANQRDGEQARVWERTFGPVVEDRAVWPEEPPTVQRDHLHVLTRSLSEVLTGKKRRKDLPSTGARGSGHVERPGRTMDPLATRQVPYDLLYDEDGNRKLEVDADGYIIGPVQDRGDSGQ